MDSMYRIVARVHVRWRMVLQDQETQWGSAQRCGHTGAIGSQPQISTSQPSAHKRRPPRVLASAPPATFATQARKSARCGQCDTELHGTEMCCTGKLATTWEVALVARVSPRHDRRGGVAPRWNVDLPTTVSFSRTRRAMHNLCNCGLTHRHTRGKVGRRAPHLLRPPSRREALQDGERLLKRLTRPIGRFQGRI
eukprot:320863-Prymnesium_polylepis.2